MPANLPPWHLWGGDKVIDLVGNPVGVAASVTTTQIAKVSYGRPDTWRFFLSCNLLETDATVGAIVVDWAIAIGVGRTAVTMNHFATWTFALPVASPFDTHRYCTAVEGPILTPFNQYTTPAPNVDSAVASQTLPPRQTIDLLPAQDIQCSARAAAFGIGAGKIAKLQLVALFVPNAHVRPEWHDREYPGGENRGH